jgi:CheY-like chemotaxis protein
VTEKPPLPEDLIAEIDRLAPQLTFLDHYAVLGVSEASSENEIKAAYLHVIKRFHPDRWQAREAGAHRKRMEAIFARATEAYEVLRRPESKLEYDRSLYEIRGIPRPSSRPKPKAPPPLPSAAPRQRGPSGTQLAMAQRMMEQLRPATITPPKSAPVALPKPAAPEPPAKPTGPRPGIVVVEDDDTLRRMLVRILQELGDVREARDGQEALDLLAADPLPRLIVTDVMMPRIDGFELARRLKAAPRTARIPIVMLTAKHGPRDVIDGVNAGARVYVTKPFKVDDLKAKALKAMGPV